ncbi:MAG: hypothetical protein R3284_12520 [Rubricoccaceae bacterium]|nr:hypothetical protein [Rubricoccaceae bacterium]
MAFMRPPFPQPASNEDLAERALRRPSSTIWLNHVSVQTKQFEEALSFYVSTLGLTLRVVEMDPSNPSRLHAVFVDAENRDILELVETDQSSEISKRIGQLSFSLPRRAWLLMRARLDAQDYPYHLVGDVIKIHDVDGIQLHITPLGKC